MRTGISNVLGNIGDVWSAANHLLQGKVHTGLDMGMRVITNTVFGLGGLLDPATRDGPGPSRSEDFGQTLGRWGVGNGPVSWCCRCWARPPLRDTARRLLVDRVSGVTVHAWPRATRRRSYAITGIEVDQPTRTAICWTPPNCWTTRWRWTSYSFCAPSLPVPKAATLVYDGAPPMESFDDEPDATPAAKPGTPAAAAAAKAVPKPGAANAGAAAAATAAAAGRGSIRVRASGCGFGSVTCGRRIGAA